MNIFSDYDYKQVVGRDSTGVLLYKRDVGGFAFFATRIIVGSQVNKFRFFIIGHGTPDDDYESHPALQLEAKLTYQFASFKNVF